MPVQRSCSRTDRNASRAVTVLAGLVANLPLTTAWAQMQNPGQSAAGCAACGALGGMLIIIPLAVVALNIALLVWVAKDAKSRGMDTPVLWMIVVMLTSVVGLIVYLLSRPKGDLVQCSKCDGRRLSTSAKCPHCGNA
jgi:cytochrome bd-type quinol oxidase subunit 2